MTAKKYNIPSDFPSLNSALLALKGNLVKKDTSVTIECYEITDQLPCVLTGWITDSNRNLSIVAPDHNYTMLISNACALYVARCRHILIDGLKIIINSVNGAWQGGINLISEYICDKTVRNCEIVGVGMSQHEAHYGIHTMTAPGSDNRQIKIENNFVYDFNAQNGINAFGLYMDSTPNTLHTLMNNTVTNCNIGIANYIGKIKAVNNRSYENGTNYYNGGGTWVECDNNLSQGNDAPGTNSTNNAKAWQLIEHGG